MPIVAMMSRDTKTLAEQRGITLTLPPKEGRTGRLPKRLLTPLVKVQDFQRGLYLKAKRERKPLGEWLSESRMTEKVTFGLMRGRWKHQHFDA